MFGANTTLPITQVHYLYRDTCKCVVFLQLEPHTRWTDEITNGSKYHSMLAQNGIA